MHAMGVSGLVLILAPEFLSGNLLRKKYLHVTFLRLMYVWQLRCLRNRHIGFVQGVEIGQIDVL
jgi:hypothetical protein